MQPLSRAQPVEMRINAGCSHVMASERDERTRVRKGMGMRPISLTAGQRPTVATIGRGPERGIPHTGTETRPRLLREAAVRNIGQWAEA